MSKGVVHRARWKIQTVRLSEEDLKRLDEIGGREYRTKSRAQTIRLMIEDRWKEMKNEQNNS